jgi:Orsellinic acid/F9775 biosynthesis cluster protein D
MTKQIPANKIDYNDHFTYLSEYRILVCNTCQCAVSNVKDHLADNHSKSKPKNGILVPGLHRNTRRKIAEQVDEAGLEFWKESDKEQIPRPNQIPFIPCLKLIREDKGRRCLECGYCSQESTMKETHAYKVHKWSKSNTNSTYTRISN